MRRKNSRMMRQMRNNWSVNKNGKTGSIDDTKLILWMNTHTDVAMGNNTFDKAKVFIDGITISH